MVGRFPWNRHANDIGGWLWADQGQHGGQARHERAGDPAEGGYFRANYSGSVVLRFIEYMDVGATNGWRMDEVRPSAEVIERIAAEFPLVPLEASAPGETAQRWRMPMAPASSG